MQFLYFGLFDPPHLGHVHRLKAVHERWAPSRTLIVPLDFYDGDIPGRRIVRTKMAAALAHTTGTLYNNTGLAIWDLQLLVARLANADEQGTVALFDPELRPGQRAEDLDPAKAGVKIITETELGLPDGLPQNTSLQRSISGDHPDWPNKVVDGVEQLVVNFGLYGWSSRANW